MSGRARDGRLAAMTYDITPRELARRERHGLHVALLWHPGDDALSVTVADVTNGQVHQAAVPRQRALHAFEHPFAYVG
jgi:hypothetical protein